MRRSLVLALLGAGCAHAPSPAPAPPLAPVLARPQLQACEQPSAAPVPPPAPRTVDALAGYAVSLESARAHDARALAACGRRLQAVNIWVAMHSR